MLERGSITNGSFLEKELFIGDRMFFGISVDKNGTIWVGSLLSVFRYDESSVRYFQEALKKQKGSPSGLPLFAVKAT